MRSWEEREREERNFARLLDMSPLSHSEFPIEVAAHDDECDNAK